MVHSPALPVLGAAMRVPATVVPCPADALVAASSRRPHPASARPPSAIARRRRLMSLTEDRLVLPLGLLHEPQPVERTRAGVPAQDRVVVTRPAQRLGPLE